MAFSGKMSSLYDNLIQLFLLVPEWFYRPFDNRSIFYNKNDKNVEFRLLKLQSHFS